MALPACSAAAPGLRPTTVLQVTVLRGENASAKSLHSVVQTLESDKVKLELKVKNLELQLKENRRQLSSSSGKRTLARSLARSVGPLRVRSPPESPSWRYALPSCRPAPTSPATYPEGLDTSMFAVVVSCCATVTTHIRQHMPAPIIRSNQEASKRTEITLVGEAK